jgi:hypothetical protein
MDQALTPGVFVIHPDHPEWGMGQVQSAVGDRITVNFEHRGKVLVDLRHARLELIGERPGPKR